MNIGRISNEDCEGNENVHSYQNECIFLKNFFDFRVYFNSLTIKWKI